MNNIDELKELNKCFFDLIKNVTIINDKIYLDKKNRTNSINNFDKKELFNDIEKIKINKYTNLILNQYMYYNDDEMNDIQIKNLKKLSNYETLSSNKIDEFCAKIYVLFSEIKVNDLKNIINQNNDKKENKILSQFIDIKISLIQEELNFLNKSKELETDVSTINFKLEKKNLIDEYNSLKNNINDLENTKIIDR